MQLSTVELITETGVNFGYYKLFPKSEDWQVGDVVSLNDIDGAVDEDIQEYFAHYEITISEIF